MRRRVQQILCGALIAGTVLASQPLPVFAETDTETVVDTSEEEVKADADYEIKVNEDNPDTAILVSCHSDATELKIPEYIDGKKITEIGDWAFKDCKQITSLELPDSIEVLGFDLFDNVYIGGHTSLEKLKLPTQEIKTVRTHPQDLQSRLSSDPVFSRAYLWGDYPMYGSDEQARKGPFLGCTELRKVEIPTGWTKVASHLFTGCTGLEYVGISDTVTELGRYAFKNCNIAVVDIPDNVETIGVECFADCPLVGIFGGKNLKEIHEWDHDQEDFDNWREYSQYVRRGTFGDGTGTFYGYKGSYLEKWATESEYSFVDLEEYEKDLDDYEIKTNEEEPWTASIVKYNGNETEVKIPKCIDRKLITEIGEDAFAKCDSITSLEIPDSVEKIGLYAFASLKKVEIADGATKIDLKIFSGAYFGNASELNIYIPKTVTEISAITREYEPSPFQPTIHGYKGSYAEKWAKENGCKFVALEAEGSAKIYGRNLTLTGKIGANVYVQVSKELLEDKDAYAKITIGDREEKVTLKDATRPKSKGKTILSFKTDVKACETNEDICIQLFSSDGRLFPITDENGKKLEDGYTFTVAETARSYANAKSSSKKLKKLADAIRNYGIYAQKQQNYKAGDLTATDDLSDIKKSTLKKYAVKKSGTVNGVSYAGVNLEMKNDTSLVVYFKGTVDFYNNYIFKVDGKRTDRRYKENNLGDGTFVYLKFDGISAQELSKEREIVIFDGKNEMSVKISPLSWAQAVLNQKNSSKETVDLAKMLYRYSSAADEYFAM